MKLTVFHLSRTGRANHPSPVMPGHLRLGELISGKLVVKHKDACCSHYCSLFVLNLCLRWWDVMAMRRRTESLRSGLHHSMLIEAGVTARWRELIDVTDSVHSKEANTPVWSSLTCKSDLKPEAHSQLKIDMKHRSFLSLLCCVIIMLFVCTDMLCVYLLCVHSVLICVVLIMLVDIVIVFSVSDSIFHSDHSQQPSINSDLHNTSSCQLMTLNANVVHRPDYEQYFTLTNAVIGQCSLLLSSRKRTSRVVHCHNLVSFTTIEFSH
jgi:hypothetical protein